jgi:hypothetical protein
MTPVTPAWRRFILREAMRRKSSIRFVAIPLFMTPILRKS